MLPFMYKNYSRNGDELRQPVISRKRRNALQAVHNEHTHYRVRQYLAKVKHSRRRMIPENHERRKTYGYSHSRRYSYYEQIMDVT